MEFCVTHRNAKSRNGQFRIFPSCHGDACSHKLAQEYTIATPNILMYTKFGRIPHVTGDVEQYFPMVRMPEMKKVRLSDLMEESLIKSLQSSGKCYKSFTCSKENAVYLCSIQDAPKISGKNISKYAEDKSISVWTTSGRRKVTPEEYMDTLSLSRIPLAEALCDISSVGDSSKRAKKSVDRTLKYLDRCIEIKNSNQRKYQTILLGGIVGGDNVVERMRCAEEMAKRDVQGFVLEGFDTLGNKFFDTLQETLKILPDDKLRLLFGVFTPDEIIDAIGLGIDIIDNSYLFNSY